VAEEQRHWDAVYVRGDADCSWTQDRARVSLAAIRSATGSPKAPIIDIGGGSSSLAGELLTAGFDDVSVLDISTAALRLAQDRLGEQAKRIHWLHGDLLAWVPQRRYAIWHDRATLHFFIGDADRARYCQVAEAAIQPGGHAIIATFAPDGPTECSGLPVRRSSAEDIATLLGPSFALVTTEHEPHRTPGGSVQSFTWCVLQRAELSEAAGEPGTS